MEKNNYAFYFKDLADKKRMLAGDPWHFDNFLLVLKEPSKYGEMGAMDFSKAEFWVQIHNAPLFCLTRETSLFLGSKIGRVVELDEEEENNKCGNFIRVRVEIDVHKPLKRLLKVDLNGGGDKRLLVIKYERLPDLCYCCGLLGHGEKECPRSAGSLITEVKQYGPWLRASSPPKRPWNRGRRDNPNEKNSNLPKNGGARAAGRSWSEGKVSLLVDNSSRGCRKPPVGEAVKVLESQRKEATKVATSVGKAIARQTEVLSEIPDNVCENREGLETKRRLGNVGKGVTGTLDKEPIETEGCGGSAGANPTLINESYLNVLTNGPVELKPIKESIAQGELTPMRDPDDRAGDMDPLATIKAQSKRKWKRQARGGPMVIDGKDVKKVNLKRGPEEVEGEEWVSAKKMKGVFSETENQGAGSLDLHAVVKDNGVSASLESVQAYRSQ